jgi:hypothetical protein
MLKGPTPSPCSHTAPTRKWYEQAALRLQGLENVECPQSWNKSSRLSSSTSSSHEPPHRSRPIRHAPQVTPQALERSRTRDATQAARLPSAKARVFLAAAPQRRRQVRVTSLLVGGLATAVGHRAHTRPRAARDHPSLAQQPRRTVLCPLACAAHRPTSREGEGKDAHDAAARPPADERSFSGRA